VEAVDGGVEEYEEGSRFATIAARMELKVVLEERQYPIHL
jgi:hypothetical protein